MATRRSCALAGGVLRPENLCYIGARSYEEGEIALLRGWACASSPWTRCSGAASTRCSPRRWRSSTRGTAGFGITIDLDGFDPEDAPGIGLREPDGFRAAPTLAALSKLARHPALRALEIVEYIPEFDERRRTAKLVRDLIVALLAPQPALADTAAHEI